MRDRLRPLFLFAVLATFAAWFSPTITSVAPGTGISVATSSGVATVSLTTPVSVANGGTNSSTALSNNRPLVSSGGKIVETASTCPAGTVLVGGSPPDCGSVPAAAVTSVNGSALPNATAVQYRIAAPDATDNSSLSSTLAANQASNFWSSVSSPDVQRTLFIFCPNGWDGGAFVLTGTDSTGSFSETVSPAPGPNCTGGATLSTVRSYIALTNARKSTVGASSATATIGPGSFLGLPVGRKINDDASVLVGTGTPMTAPVQDPVNFILQPGIDFTAPGDPSFQPNTALNGVRNFLITVGLQ